MCTLFLKCARLSVGHRPAPTTARLHPSGLQQRPRPLSLPGESILFQRDHPRSTLFEVLGDLTGKEWTRRGGKVVGDAAGVRWGGGAPSSAGGQRRDVRTLRKMRTCASERAYIQKRSEVHHLHSQAFCSFCSTPLGNDCGLNVFIVMTMVLAFGFAVIGSLLPASVIPIYGAFMCYTALSSEPRGYACNGLRHSSAVSVSTSSWDGDDYSFSSVLCITCSIFNNFSVTTILSVLYSALRARFSTTFLSPP
ncbi:hypothetical protein ACLB2K_013947 [Fragaria x ananassa]